MKKLIGITVFLSIVSAVTVFGATNTTTFVEKFFTVSNFNPNATSPLIGTAAMKTTNSPFYIPTNISFSVMGTQYYRAFIRLDTAKTGKFTNWVLFSSNGGNTTNMVYGTVLPGGVANFRFVQ
jgi:hypothetical protein